MKELQVATSIHGRVLVEGAADSFSAPLLVAFHGYGQSAEDVLDEVRRIPGVASWRIAAVQALHRFYARHDQRVVASWMTRQDRELAIKDNVEYVDKTLDLVVGRFGDGGRLPIGSPVPIVFLGFSQGASMAYRAARLGRHGAAGVVALAGDIPPELKVAAPPDVKSHMAWPRVLIGAGKGDNRYTAEKLDADVSFLQSTGLDPDVVRFDGGHEWTDEFRNAIGRWLKRTGIRNLALGTS